jgi:quinol monooxygenase YgiN
MFVQVIEARTTDTEAVFAASARWERDVRPGAIGFLGSTLGVTDDGRIVVVARFESAEAADRNAQRPEQSQWWADLQPYLDGEATFRDSEDVTVDLTGDPDRAGFVQVMKGQVTDPARAKELMAQFPQEAMADFRPDILGSVMIGHEDGRWTQVLYFTSEAEAREGEKKPPPLDWQATMDQLTKISVGEPEFIDLRRPVLVGPA